MPEVKPQPAVASSQSKKGETECSKFWEIVGVLAFLALIVFGINKLVKYLNADYDTDTEFTYTTGYPMYFPDLTVEEEAKVTIKLKTPTKETKCEYENTDDWRTYNCTVVTNTEQTITVSEFLQLLANEYELEPSKNILTSTPAITTIPAKLIKQ